jgi:formylglycine-generating enzyme required for sulfatase activity
MGDMVDQAVNECNKYNVDYCQDSRFANEAPPHSVYLDAYYMDTYEVTNEKYRICVDEGACSSPQKSSSSTRPKYFGDPQFDKFPVIYVNWDMARTYCEWRSGQLPTEAQWEKAARGTDERTYPWGEGLQCGFANYFPQSGKPCISDTTSVGSYAVNISPYGIYDMAGNVWEWVLDWHTDYYDPNWPSDNPTGSPTGTYRILRGGSWFDYDFSVRSAFRGRADPMLAENFVGFRCVRFP